MRGFALFTAAAPTIPKVEGASVGRPGKPVVLNLPRSGGTIPAVANNPTRQEPSFVQRVPIASAISSNACSAV